MQGILINAASLLLMIALGYLLKRIGFLHKADGGVISMIVLNLTLPAAIVVNLSRMDFQFDQLFMIIAGIGLTFLQLAVAWWFSRKSDPLARSFVMFLASGFNIGNFTLPFVQSFVPAGIPPLSMFDMGNSIMLAGGTEVVVDRMGKTKQAFDVRKVALQLLKSVPYTCYIVMFLLGIFHLRLPAGVIQLIQPMASSNTFLSMFMIGLYLELQLPKSESRLVWKTLLIRYGTGGLFILFFLLLPLSALDQMILCLLAITPVPVFGVINAVKKGAAAETVGFCSSISFLISLPLMTLILLLFQK